MTDPRDTMRWVWRGIALAALVIGWVFIAWQNHFHITAPLAFVCLGYLAVVATVYNLWRTGAAAVGAQDEDADSTWAKPAGAVGELEREKRTLLKAIKEAEFDHQMGKLSQRDADEMIRGYRARAIEVIKEIDRLGLGAAGTVREQILREVRARVELEARSSKKPSPEARANAPANAKGKKSPRAKDAPPGGTPGATSDAAKPIAADPASAGVAEAARAAATEVVLEAAIGTAADAGAPGAVQVPSDEELDADSTTALEPRRDDPAKEATP